MLNGKVTVKAGDFSSPSVTLVAIYIFNKWKIVHKDKDLNAFLNWKIISSFPPQLFFCKLKPHAKFQNPRRTLSGRRYPNGERKNYSFYMLLKVELLWHLYLYYTIWSFECKFKPNKCNKPCIIAEIKNSQFAEILNVPEMCLREVLNFSHVWG